jgi:ketosteroid isomerase-like protein
MSQENVEIVRRAWEAWIAGDLDAQFESFHPEVEVSFEHFDGWPENPVVYGHDGVRKFFVDWLASWERYEAGVEEYIDVDHERVLVLCWQRGYGPGSHVPVQMDWAQIVTIKDGLVLRMDSYSDRPAAREAVDLPATAP